MKKTLALLIAAMLVFAAGPCAVQPVRAEEKELTILLYICGSDLESENGQASGDIREMLSSGIASSAGVNVLLATGGSRDWQKYGISPRNVQYYRLEAGGPKLLKDAGRLSMGDAGTLSGFLRFGLSAAPARRYMLIIWDHGGGPVFGLCYDENFRDDGLSLSELRSGLTDGLNGTVLDLIGFDCCLMNCVDLCADLRGIADYSVLSQEMVTGTGFDYDAWMKPLVSDPTLSTGEIAASIAQTYVADNSRGRSAGTATMSVIDTDKMTRVMEAADSFSASLSALLRTNLAGVVRLRTKLVSFGEFLDEDASDLVDVEAMCDTFSALLPRESAALKDAARDAVYCNFTTDDIAPYAHGLSFFMPLDTVRSDRQEILAHYSGQSGDYSGLAVALTNQASSSGYAMTASSYTPSSFFSNNDGGCSGAFCDMWDGYYGDCCSFEEVYESWGTGLWDGLNTASGAVWDGYGSSGGIWSGLGSAASSPQPIAGGIWAGLPSASPAPEGPVSSAAPEVQTASEALNNIWQGLLNSGADYYQPGEENQNLQPGISEAVSADAVLQEAGAYFSSATLSSQMIYSLQLNKQDLDHLSAATGVLSRQEGDEILRLGNLGQTTIDWSTGLIFSMFDGSWPTLEGQMVRAERLYADDAGNIRFIIPARINGLKMYLLGNHSPEGNTALLGATQGYDETGSAIRGWIPLEEGMTVYPLFTAVSADGSQREYAGSAITVPKEGLKIAWEKIPGGAYLYCFGLTDLTGQVHYTDSVAIGF